MCLPGKKNYLNIKDKRCQKSYGSLVLPIYFTLCWMWSALAVLRELIKVNKVAKEHTSQLGPGFYGTAQDYTKSMRGVAQLIP